MRLMNRARVAGDRFTSTSTSRPARSCALAKDGGTRLGTKPFPLFQSGVELRFAIFGREHDVDHDRGVTVWHGLSTHADVPVAMVPRRPVARYTGSIRFAPSPPG